MTSSLMTSCTVAHLTPCSVPPGRRHLAAGNGIHRQTGPTQSIFGGQEEGRLAAAGGRALYSRDFECTFDLVVDDDDEGKKHSRFALHPSAES